MNSTQNATSTEDFRSSPDYHRRLKELIARQRKAKAQPVKVISSFWRKNG